MNDIERNILLTLKEMLEKEKKEYNKIQSILFSLFNKQDYNVDDCKTLISFLAENQKSLCEFRDYYLNMLKRYDEKQRKGKGDKDGANSYVDKKEQKKDLEKEISIKIEKKNVSSESKKDTTKEEVEINVEEIKKFENLCKKMEKFPDYMKDKNHPIIHKLIKDWLTGFLKLSIFNKKESFKYKKNKIDNKTKELNRYKSICEIYEKNKLDNCNLNILFEKLNTISFDYLDEQQKNKLINICLYIFHKLTEKRKKNLKDKYSKLIKDEEISKLLFLDFKNIFLDEIDTLIYLSQNVEEASKNRNKKKIEIIKFNEENICEKLLEIYNEFMYNKNKNNSYISLNKDNIEEKFYFFFIINIITYKEVFNTG